MRTTTLGGAMTRRRPLEKMAYGENEPWYSRLSRKAWGALGAGAGSLLYLKDKATGYSGGAWKDYARTGWHIGHDNADRLAASAIEGAAIGANGIAGLATSVGVPQSIVARAVPTQWASRLADYAYDHDNNGYRALSDGNYEHIRGGMNAAGGIGVMAATGRLMSKAFGAAQQGLTRIGRAGWDAFLHGPTVATRTLGAAQFPTALYGTAKLWGLDDPMNNIVAPAKEIASGAKSWLDYAWNGDGE